MTWSVPPPTVDEAVSLFKYATKILPTTDLLVTLQNVYRAYPGATLHVLPRTRQFPDHRPEVVSDGAFKDGFGAREDLLLTAIAKARLIKSPWEVEMIRKANDISSRAHETVMRVLAQGVKNGYKKKEEEIGKALVPGEWTIESEPDGEAIFVAACHREGWASISSSLYF